jgi:hypothetical protein
MRADAAESITCGWLSFVVVVGLLADLMLGAWWVDAVTSLVIVGFVVKEAREAWSGEDCCDHGTRAADEVDDRQHDRHFHQHADDH